MADLPVPVLVKRYECPFCRRRRSSKAATAEHIARCWHNPAVRCCKTCANYEYYAGSGLSDPCIPGEHCNCDAPEQYCRAGVLFRADDEPFTGCPLWSAKPDESESATTAQTGGTG